MSCQTLFCVVAKVTAHSRPLPALLKWELWVHPHPVWLHPGFQAHFPAGCLPHSSLMTTRRWCNVFFAHVWPPNEVNRSFMEVEVAASEWQQSLQEQPITFQLSSRSAGAGLWGVTWEPLSRRWKTSCSECLASRRGNELGFMTWVAKQQEVRLWKCLLSDVCSLAAFKAADGYFSRKDSAKRLGRGPRHFSPTSHQ